MNGPTLAALPVDVRAGLSDVILDESIPNGMVEVRGPRAAYRVTSDHFVAQRRALRKRERQNRKRGRKG